MDPDPFMPATQRFPMIRQPAVIDNAAPSEQRPYILRGLTPTPAERLDGIILAKHRTPATQRKIPATTSLDEKQVDDSYPVPDD